MDYSKYRESPKSPTKFILNNGLENTYTSPRGSPRPNHSHSHSHSNSINSIESSPLKPRSPTKVNSDYPILSPIQNNHPLSRSPSPTRHHYHLFDSSNDISQLKSSSQSHFRTLAAEKTIDITDGDIHIPGITDQVEDVAGLQGRIRLQRSDTTSSSSYISSRNWMDKQRKNLQAYEYLCHIGEAKEWIENCIDEEIPPIIKLEEALRDGVILAKLTKVFAPHIVRRIFENPKLQFKHSENINYFFTFLDQIGIPDLFTFELTDLYDKKNIPKVIYCIHALSFILSAEDLAPSIGNLVGKLEFTDDEIYHTQKGLDANGINLPNFSSMGKHFQKEDVRPPSPPPISEEEQREIDLEKCKDEVIMLQAICRGALSRRESNVVEPFVPEIISFQAVCRGALGRRDLNVLQSCVNQIIALQAASRGALFRFDFNADKYILGKTSDQVTIIQSYGRGFILRKRLNQLRNLHNNNFTLWSRLQAGGRGALVRAEMREKQYDLKFLALPDILSLQAVIRGNNVRGGFVSDKKVLDKLSIKLPGFQGVIRGGILRRKKDGLRQVLESEVDSIIGFQSLIRGLKIQKEMIKKKEYLKDNENVDNIVNLQSVIRAKKLRKQLDIKNSQVEEFFNKNNGISSLQSIIRAGKVRRSFQNQMNTIHDNEKIIKQLQSVIRGGLIRNEYEEFKQQIFSCNSTINEFQSISRGYLLRSKVDHITNILKSEERAILTIQSIFRGNLVREDVSSHLTKLDIFTPSIIQLQSVFRGIITRFAYSLMLEEFEEEEENIVSLQAITRGYLVRKEFKDRMDYFKQNMDKIIKIQSFVRAKKQGDAYKSLITGQNPPLSTVKSFVHLLADSELDFEQEIILEQNRKRVIDEVRNNEQLEQFITQLDVKIALLLKNKITIDELIRHRNKGVKAKISVNSSTDMFDLKALNKTSRRRLELYQGLFYIIQTQPQYLARLFSKLHDRVMIEKETKDIEGLVMNLYGYAQKSREEFFLLKLIGRSIQEEIEKSENIKSFLRGNFIWWKLVGAINRGTKSRKSLKDILGNAVMKVVEAQDLDLESDPLAIHRASINNEELITGRLSSRSPNVPVDEAIQDPETRAIFINNLQNLRELSTIFLDDIENNIDSLSYHIRYIAREIYNCGKRVFGESEREKEKDKLLSVVGHVLFNHYLIPAITLADSYGIVNSSLTAQQTKSLHDVTKILTQISTLRPFSKDNVYLQPLNDHVKICISRMKAFFKKVIYVQDLEQEFNTNIFDDLTSHQKPKLYLKTSDIFSMHSLICQELDIVAPNEDDSLRDVLRQLGSLPNDASEILNIARFNEIKLDLNPSFCRVEDPEAEITSLFVTTKRCMLYVLRVQTGANLLDILLSPVSEEHEEKYKAILKEETVERSKRNIAYSENALGDLSKLTYRELKFLTLEKVIELESLGRITREDNYQGILNSIALDIKTKRNRQISREKEMDGIKQTLQNLQEKESYLQTQLKTYNNYIEQAMSTLQTKKGKRKPLVLPFTKQYFHIRELQRSGRVPKFGSYKYSASNLFEKGVLVELNGYSDKQYNQVTFTFSSDEVGVFNIEAAYGLIVLPGASATITLDELLGQQYNNIQYISLFDDMVKLNTNLTLHFIFKKFYGDSQ